jgi:hypothetical protein
MPGPRSRLPSLDDGVAFAKGVARVLSEITGDPYGEPALSELEAGKEKTEQGLGNPVAFAHTVIDWYAQATGDFLYGTGEVSRLSRSPWNFGGGPILDQAASSLVGVTAPMVWSSATRSPGRYR